MLKWLSTTPNEGQTQTKTSNPNHKDEDTLAEHSERVSLHEQVPLTENSEEKALKRIKSYLRATTTDKRLNHLMLLHFQKERVDQLSMIDIANDFVSRVECRKEIFGDFTVSDLKPKVSLESKATQT